MSTIAENILSKIFSLPDSAIFIADDFLDCGARESVCRALIRLAKKGTIRRILPGLYDKPEYCGFLNALSPPAISDIPEILARKNHWNIAPDGNAALNRLGLDTQVPARRVYNSSGPSRFFRIGNAVIEFRHVAPGLLKAKNRITLLIVQAMTMPAKYFTADQMKYLSTRLTEMDKNQICADLPDVPKKFRSKLQKIIG